MTTNLSIPTLTIPITIQNNSKIQKILAILNEFDSDSDCDSSELEDDYHHIGEYRIKKSRPGCGEKGKKSIEWFRDKVIQSPELMLNCPYCQKTFWKKSSSDSETTTFIKHRTKCKKNKKNVEYQDNIRVRS